MKNTRLKMMAMMLLVVAFSCQKNEIEDEPLSPELEEFVKQNNLKILEKGSPTAFSFKSIEEAQAFIDKVNRSVKSFALLKDEEKPNGSNNRTTQILPGTRTFIIDDALFGSDLKADISYTWCNANGDIINDPSSITLSSRLTGFTIATNWFPSIQSATWLNSRAIQYRVKGNLRVGLEIETGFGDLPAFYDFEIDVLGVLTDPAGNGDPGVSGTCDTSGNDTGNDTGGNTGGGNNNDGHHVGHPGGCPPGHELH